MKKQSALAWKIKRIAQKPFRRRLDRHALKKANQTALDERISRAKRANFLESELNRIVQTKEYYNPDELLRIARTINQYAHQRVPHATVPFAKTASNAPPHHKSAARIQKSARAAGRAGTKKTRKKEVYRLAAFFFFQLCIFISFAVLHNSSLKRFSRKRGFDVFKFHSIDKNRGNRGAL